MRATDLEKHLKINSAGYDKPEPEFPRSTNTITTLASEQTQLIPENLPCDNRSTAARIANGATFGLTGLFFFTTSLASVMSLMPNLSAGVTLGLLAAVPSGIVNSVITTTATEVLFRKEIMTKLFTAATFATIGRLAALPIVAAVLQATSILSKKTGLSITKIDPFIGNATFIIIGLAFSLGAVNIIVQTYANLMYYVFKKPTYLKSIQQHYLSDYRSPEEYRSFIDNPQQYLRQKHSPINLAITATSLGLSFATNYAYGGEIVKAVSKESMVLFMSLISIQKIDDFAKTDTGSKLIALGINALFSFMFICTSMRALPRHLSFLGKSIIKKEPAKAIIMTCELILVFATLGTGLLEATKGGSNLGLTITSTAGAFLTNFTGMSWFFMFMVVPNILKQLTSWDVEQFLSEFPIYQAEAAKCEAIESLSAP